MLHPSSNQLPTKRISFSILISLTAVCIFACTGCANQSKQMSGEQLGVLLGAVAGASAGKNNSSKFAGAIIGATAGGMLGNAIGRYLDDNDKLKAQAAANAAVRQPSSATVTWKSDRNSGVSGTVYSSSPLATNQGSCKRVTHLINVNGKEHREDTQLCQRSDGSWSAA